MSDPVRLLASADATDLERELLGAWSDERPSAAARDKTLAVLGLAGGAAAAAAGTTVAAAGSSIAPKAVAAGWLAMAKWVVIGVIAASATAVGIGIVARERGEQRTLDAPPVTNAPLHVVVAPPPSSTVVAPSDTAIELPDTTRLHAQNKIAQPASSSITQQVAALDHARAALDSGDAARAKHLADAYEAEYPSGAFTQEADVVRVDALVREGNRAEAERAGKRFLAAYPKSPHAARVRALLGYDP